MVRLKRLEVLPTTRAREGRWSAEPAIDVFLSAARGVCEALSVELSAADLSGRRSWLEFYARSTDGEHAVAEVARSHDASFGDGNLYVPPRFASLTPDEAASAVLDLLGAALRELAAAYQWPRERLEALRERVEDVGLRFTWRSPWKAAPGRRHEASGVYRIADDGLGRVQLEVRCRGQSEVLARTEEGVTCGTAKALQASAATLRWRDAGSVAVVPWVDLAGQQQGLLEVVLNQPVVAPLVAGRPVRPTRAFPTRTVRVHYGALAHMDEEARREAVLWLHESVSIGYKVKSNKIESSWARAADNLRDTVDGAAWMAGTPYVSLHVVLEIDHDDNPLVGGGEIWHDAVGDHLLISFPVNAARLNALSDEQRQAELIELLRKNLERIAARRHLGAPPWTQQAHRATSATEA
ncbi:MAG TPA: hypothetical protein VFR07_02685 [Mycobacteriales bacterium]|jgi:hypothetical protein|nr:hypothetical protein [Mycobacteriales bacterium]